MNFCPRLSATVFLIGIFIPLISTCVDSSPIISIFPPFAAVRFLFSLTWNTLRFGILQSAHLSADFALIFVAVAPLFSSASILTWLHSASICVT